MGTIKPPRTLGPARARTLARRMFRAAGKSGTDVSVFIVSNREMNAIRKRLKAMPHFRGKEADKIRRERYVSVLSFPVGMPLPSPKPGSRSAGEVYLNRDYAKRDGAALLRLLLHGVLHLLGYKHERKNDIIRMEALEKKIWHRIFSSAWISERQLRK